MEGDNSGSWRRHRSRVVIPMRVPADSDRPTGGLMPGNELCWVRRKVVRKAWPVSPFGRGNEASMPIFTRVLAGQVLLPDGGPLCGWLCETEEPNLEHCRLVSAGEIYEFRRTRRCGQSIVQGNADLFQVYSGFKANTCKVWSKLGRTPFVG